MAGVPTFTNEASNVKDVGEWRDCGSKNPFMSALLHAKRTGESIIKFRNNHIDAVWHFKKCGDGFIELKKYRRVNWS